MKKQAETSFIKQQDMNTSMKDTPKNMINEEEALIPKHRAAAPFPSSFPNHNSNPIESIFPEESKFSTTSLKCYNPLHENNSHKRDKYGSRRNNDIQNDYYLPRKNSYSISSSQSNIPIGISSVNSQKIHNNKLEDITSRRNKKKDEGKELVESPINGSGIHVRKETTDLLAPSTKATYEQQQSHTLRNIVPVVKQLPRIPHNQQLQRYPGLNQITDTVAQKIIKGMSTEGYSQRTHVPPTVLAGWRTLCMERERRR